MGNGSSIEPSKTVYLEVNGKEEKVGVTDVVASVYANVFQLLCVLRSIIPTTKLIKSASICLLVSLFFNEQNRVLIFFSQERLTGQVIPTQARLCRKYLLITGPRDFRFFHQGPSP